MGFPTTFSIRYQYDNDSHNDDWYQLFCSCWTWEHGIPVCYKVPSKIHMVLYYMYWKLTLQFSETLVPIFQFAVGGRETKLYSSKVKTKSRKDLWLYHENVDCSRNKTNSLEALLVIQSIWKSEILIK